MVIAQELIASGFLSRWWPDDWCWTAWPAQIWRLSLVAFWSPVGPTCPLVRCSRLRQRWLGLSTACRY